MERLFTRFFEKSISPSAIAAGPEYRLVYVNEAWVQLFGYSKQEAIGRTAFELGIQPDLASWQRALEALQAGNAVSGMEFVLRTRFGRELHVATDLTRLVAKGKEYVLSSLRDISEQKHTHTELRQRDAALLDSLTPREREVMRLALAGYCNKDIAHSLGVSCRTVEAHRAHSIRKLGTRSLLKIKQMADAGGL